MEDPGSPADIRQRMKSVAPLNEADAEQLHNLLVGVRAAANRMADLAPVFPGEIDSSRLSLTIDGEDA